MTYERTAAPTPETGPAFADLEDERLRRSEGLKGAATGFIDRVRAGDLGSLPVVVGLIVIWVIFEILSQGVFLSANNLVFLLVQIAAVGPIAIGIVLVLLLGEIDLSVGSVSGLAAAVLAVMAVNSNVPIGLAIVASLAVGILIGLLYGFLYNRFGVPSFVITLAGLLAFLGAQVIVLGPDGTINLPQSSSLVQFAAYSFLPPWLAYALAIVAGASILVGDLLRNRRRRKAGLSTMALSITLVKSIALAVVLLAVTAYLATDRGTSLMFVVFVLLVVAMNYLLQRTRWGRAVYAIGGNVEAARRAGLKVRAVYFSVFILCSTFAVVGGLFSAGYGATASAQSGTGDVNLNAIAAAVIGGTSLFGGRGSAWSALLGVIVIQSIASGLNLISIDTNTRFIVTGAVLLLAVIVDSLSRRSRVRSGA
ncbi:sugar ABC transporter permease [Amnibacterium endophyticum]|uniref:Xylose transport system permease protein XylH n=1 Tax=Amnibacterium endophyticum TaxID=2109337 RepID=A0ABW4LEG9_9MICO